MSDLAFRAMQFAREKHANQRRANALNAIRAALGELGEVILKENFSWSSDAFAKDLSSWRNALAAYGYKPDGTVKKVKPKKETA